MQLDLIEMKWRVVSYHSTSTIDLPPFLFNMFRIKDFAVPFGGFDLPHGGLMDCIGIVTIPLVIWFISWDYHPFFYLYEPLALIVASWYELLCLGKLCSFVYSYSIAIKDFGVQLWGVILLWLWYNSWSRASFFIGNIVLIISICLLKIF